MRVQANHYLANLGLFSLVQAMRTQRNTSIEVA
jgi:hypothetical protein